jgi:hypothetical protein
MKDGRAKQIMNHSAKDFELCREKAEQQDMIWEKPSFRRRKEGKKRIWHAVMFSFVPAPSHSSLCISFGDAAAKRRDALEYNSSCLSFIQLAGSVLERQNMRRLRLPFGRRETEHDIQ